MPEDSPHRIVKRKLEEILHSQTGAYLFVGAGISRRYAGLPDWSGLLREFAKYTNRPYDYYVVRSESDLAVAAGIIADEFLMFGGMIHASKVQYLVIRDRSRINQYLSR